MKELTLPELRWYLYKLESTWWMHRYHRNALAIWELLNRRALNVRNIIKRKESGLPPGTYHIVREART